MEWFRLYGEFATDPKVQSMPEVMQRRLLMLFCLTCNETLHTLKDEEIAFALRISEDELADTKQLFMKKNFVDDSWAIVKWDVRQMPSDVSKGRVAKYRANRKALGLSSNGYTKHSDTVMLRDGHACVYCESTENLCIDHAYPVALGGNDDVENLVCACKACNSGKAGRTPSQAGLTFKNKRTESIWNGWMEYRGVTVTVTPQSRREEIREEETRGKPKTKPPRVPRFDAQAHLVSLGVEPKVAADWLTQRKAKNLEPTETAFDATVTEAEKAGLSLNDAVKECCANGWGGFKAKWLQNEIARGGGGGGTVTPLNKQEALEKRNRTIAMEFAQELQHANK